MKANQTFEELAAIARLSKDTVALKESVDSICIKTINSFLKPEEREKLKLKPIKQEYFKIIEISSMQIIWQEGIDLYFEESPVIFFMRIDFYENDAYKIFKSDYHRSLESAEWNEI